MEHSSAPDLSMSVWMSNFYTGPCVMCGASKMGLTFSHDLHVISIYSNLLIKPPISCDVYITNRLFYVSKANTAWLGLTCQRFARYVTCGI